MTFTKFTHFIEILPNKLKTQHEVHGKKRIEWLFIWECYLFVKDFSFVINFVSSSKSETQYVIHKIYSHFIETPPSKSKNQHGVHIV